MPDADCKLSKKIELLKRENYNEGIMMITSVTTSFILHKNDYKQNSSLSSIRPTCYKWAQQESFAYCPAVKNGGVVAIRKQAGQVPSPDIPTRCKSGKPYKKQESLLNNRKLSKSSSAS
jgi:hypothetical protein